MNARQLLDELLKCYQGYAILLAEELNEVVPIAAAHGRKSKRFKEGEKYRKQMEEITMQLEKLI